MSYTHNVTLSGELQVDKQIIDETALRDLLGGMTEAELTVLMHSAEGIASDVRKNKLSMFVSNEKQIDIVNSHKKNVVIFGGNRTGKSEIAAFITACHLTGLYPDWWLGPKFDHPIAAGVVSISAEQLRKSGQKKLMGEFFEVGTGYIPAHLIIKKTTRIGTVGAFDTVLVKHVSGGVSKLEFMINEQGPAKFMGFDWDWCWIDEEIDKGIYEEIKMRLVDRNGRLIMSFTPLKGYTPLIQHIDNLPEKYVDIFYLHWTDNPHLAKEAVAEMEATMSEADKESRKFGRANYGEGRIFTFSEDKYTCEPFQIESYWPVLGGLDPGYGHPTGALKAVVDPESGTIYITAEYWNKENTPIMHAPILLGWGNMEFKIDRSAKRRSQTDGKDPFSMYEDLGLRVSAAATDSGSVEASISMIQTLIMQGRLFIFSSCRRLLDQMSMYRRAINKSSGKVSIVAKDNDLIDPLRYIILHIDEARPMGVPKKKIYSAKTIDFTPLDARIGY